MPLAGDIYAEHAPSAPLRPYVECYWTRTGSAAGIHRVLPDGCIDIVFNLGEGARERSAVVGTMTRPLLVAASGRQDFLGVRFRPGQAGAFLKFCASELTNDAAPLDNFWGDAARLLLERLAESTNSREHVGLLEAALCLRLRDTRPANAVLGAAVETILDRRGRLSVRELSARSGHSRQHLARLFDEHVGIPPKTFCRVVRFQNLLEHVRHSRAIRWADAAAESGYYDQAHLIADFRQFTGLPPTAYRAQR